MTCYDSSKTTFYFCILLEQFSTVTKPNDGIINIGKCQEKYAKL